MFRSLRFGFLLVAIFAVTLTAVVAQDGDEAAGPSAADMKEIHDYALTMDKIERMAKATAALEKIEQRHPDLDSVNESKGLADMEQKFEKFPEAVAVIKQYGFSVRDYVDCLATTMQATVEVGFKRQNHLKDYRPDALQAVNRANLDLIDQHWDEIQKITGGNSDE